MKRPSIVEILQARQRKADMDSLMRNTLGKRKCITPDCDNFLSPRQTARICHTCRANNSRREWRQRMREGGS